MIVITGERSSLEMRVRFFRRTPSKKLRVVMRQIDFVVAVANNDRTGTGSTHKFKRPG